MATQSSNSNAALLLRVFLASPGDVTDERGLALKVLERLQYDPFLRGKISIETVAWDKEGADTPMLASMTPQEAISLQRPKPSECDVVVVIFWSRMGTPLPSEYKKDNGNPYLSGTEWEYLDALNASHEHGRPKVLVYRRGEEPKFGAGDSGIQEKLRQWALVNSFFESFKNPDQSIASGYNDYDIPDTFEKKLTGHLKEIFHQLLANHEAEVVLPESETGATVQVPSESTTVPELWKGSPFPGLRPFGEKDAPIYFGRGRETDGLIRRLSDGQRFIAVVGASGSGKSSLVAAGLLPRLAANAIPGSRDWITLRFPPSKEGDNPFVALAAGFKSVLDPQQRKVRGEAATLEQDPQALVELMDLLLSDSPRWAELLLFVDQFEELFTVVDGRYRAPFSRLLAQAAEIPRLRTVLTVRADFYHRCVEQAALEDLLRSGTYPLAAPDQLALEEMITLPAARAGLEFDEGLPAQILEDTGEEPGALPLLAFSLSELYESGKSGGKLTRSTYEGFGGVQGAIGQRADTTFDKLDKEAQDCLPSVFRELVEVEEAETGWVATRRRATLEKVTTSDPAKRLVDAFLEARLLVSDEDQERHPTLEVAHEALLSHWGRLHDWIAKTGQDLQVLRQFQSAAADWARQDHRKDLLWPRRRRIQAAEVVDSLHEPLGDTDRAFLAASQRRTTVQTSLLGAGLSIAVLVVGLFVWLFIEDIRLPDAWAVAKLKWGSLPELNMVTIEPGEFWMGSPEDDADAESDEQQHPVTIERPFEIGRYEVTFDEYDFFARVTKRPLPSDDRSWGRGRRPVTNVSWRDATAYAQWLSDMTGEEYRLPTEAEWEYAARACRGLEAECQGSRYWWGDQIDEGEKVWANCDGCGSGYDADRTAPVDDPDFKANAFGLYHTAGNVWEWTCSSYQDRYDGAETQCIENLESYVPRVFRGGSWYYGPRGLRSASRSYGYPVNRNDFLGFRLARSL